MSSHADLIARAVLLQFDALPSKRKPAVRDNGLHEWVPLSGIVAESEGDFTCLALATGMKCLPASKLPESHGAGIHDWHAEVLTIRAFNRLLLDECQSHVEYDTVSSVIQRTVASDASKPFQIRDNVKLHMYCSEAPCGDASMELTMAAQEDASPWESPMAEVVEANDSLLGRAQFSQLGIVRRKPARGDAPPTLSKSCSDKLALKQCTSLLSSLASLFIDPGNAYIDTLVLPHSQHSAEACQRAFSKDGRMSFMVNRPLPESYNFKPFSVETTDVEFQYSRRAVQARSERISASNLAAAWAFSGFEESLIGGVIRGRKLADDKRASGMSRKRMWMTAKTLARELQEALEIERDLRAGFYRDVKDGPLLKNRRRVKAEVCNKALVGWVKNEGDSDFSIDDAVHVKC